MNAVISPSGLSGTVTAPASKSLSQRAIAAAFLHKGTTTIDGAGESEDETAALGIIQSFGASVQRTGSRIVISSTGIISPDCHEIHCGESGLAARLFTPVAATAAHPIKIQGTGSLLSRPMHALIDALSITGVRVTDISGHLPFTVQGPMRPQPGLSFDGGSGSQTLSGLLFALSHIIREPLTIEVRDLTSRPYIDLSMDVLRQAGAIISHTDYASFSLSPKADPPGELHFAVEGDWSNGAAWIVAGGVTGAVMNVSSLWSESSQGDRAVLSAACQAGVLFSRTGSDTISIGGPSALRAFSIDLTHTPDLFPVLAVLAARCAGWSGLTGTHRLVDKESNRMNSIAALLKMMGVDFFIEKDILRINGSTTTNGGIISSYQDHRIVMAAAIAGLVATEPVTITGARSIAKSYPRFFADLQSLGASVEFQPNV
jgi:3-phosphoshikimate 1-carboxyvinyltransferase